MLMVNPPSHLDNYPVVAGFKRGDHPSGSRLKGRPIFARQAQDLLLRKSKETKLSFNGEEEMMDYVHQCQHLSLLQVNAQ